MPAPAQGGGQADNSLAPLWIILTTMVCLGLVWYFYRVYIIDFIVTIRGYEADLLSLVVPDRWAERLQNAQAFIASVKAGNTAHVSMNDLGTLSTQIGYYFRIPVALILSAMALFAYFKNPTSRFKKTYSMKTLLADEKTNWPPVVPINKLDLVNEDLDKGPWAMSLPPMQFAKKYNLLIADKPVVSEALLSSKVVQTASINRELAREVFSLQIGPFWENAKVLPIHTRALFAIFAGRIAGDREGSTNLLAQISNSTETGRLNFSGVDQLLTKHLSHKIVTKILKQHAFVLTVMASMLVAAREDGVLAASEFLWLKAVDRRLWFMLSSVGRQTPFCEVSGPFAHWLAEKELNRRLNVAMIEEAVNGLELGIKEFIYKPDEPEEEVKKD